MKDKNQKLARWYFGGLGSAGAACCTHPLDLLKVSIRFRLLRFCLRKRYSDYIIIKGTIANPASW